MRLESKQHQHRGKARAFLDAGFLVVLVIVTLILQTSGEAYAGSFGSQPDEPAHYVTSLMIRDYLAGNDGERERDGDVSHI